MLLAFWLSSFAGLSPSTRTNRRRQRHDYGLPVAAEYLENREMLTAPFAGDANFDATHGTPITTLPLLSYALDMDGDPLTVTSVSNLAGLTANSDGSYTYTPATTFVGTASFTYTVSGGGETSNAGTIAFAYQNNAPTANDASLSASHGTPITTNPRSARIVG